jgi:hypothetical protein
MKLDDFGNIEWQKSYGGTKDDSLNSIVPTPDREGFIAVGSTRSFGEGELDVWVIKLDDSGDIEWQNTYGDTRYDNGRSIRGIPGGEFIVAGGSNSFGVGPYNDIWLLRLHSNGQIQWQKTYGGVSRDDFHSIELTSDNGFILSASSFSFSNTNSDAWILKLNASGDIEWQNIYSGQGPDQAFSIDQVADGGFIVAGTTELSNQDRGAWTLKLDVSGNIQWQRTYNTSRVASAAVIQTVSGGFVMAGTNVADLWASKLNEDGNIPSCSLIDIAATNMASTNTDAITSSISPQAAEAVYSDISAVVVETTATPIRLCHSSASTRNAEYPLWWLASGIIRRIGR